MTLHVSHWHYRHHDGTDCVAFVLSLNLHRRHLTTSQRAMVAARVATLKHGTNQHRKEEGQKRPSTIIEAADQLSVGSRTIRRAKRLLKDGHPDIINEVEAGSLSVHKALEVSKYPRTDQPMILSKMRKLAIERTQALL